MTAAALAVAAFVQGWSDRICFTAAQKKAAGDRHYDIVVSDEAIERAMRVYTPEECLDTLRCIPPGSAAT